MFGRSKRVPGEVGRSYSSTGADGLPLIAPRNRERDDWARIASLTGAWAKDMANPGANNIGQTGAWLAEQDQFRQAEDQQVLAQRQAETQRKANADAYAKAMAGGRFDGNAYLQARAQAGLPLTPQEIAGIQGMDEPSYINSARGIFEVRPGQAPRMVEGSAAEPDAPNGFRWENGRLVPIPGGPADPAYIGSVAGERREAVVSRPTPRVAAPRKGGGAPWARNWGG